MTTPALMIVDMQKAIDDPAAGRRGQPEMEDRIAALLAAWRERRLPVVHVRHDSPDPASPYRPGAEGNDFKDVARPEPGEPVIDKRTSSAFIATDLMDALDELMVRRLVVAGAFLEGAVGSTVRMAGNLGFEVVVPEDAVASLEHVDRDGRRWSAEDVHALSLAVIDGAFAEITTADAILEELP